MKKVLSIKDAERCIGCYSCMLACARVTKQNYSPQLSAIQVRTRGGLQGKFTVHGCRGCPEPLCAAACAFGALERRPGGGALFNRDKCQRCGLCIGGCPIGVVGLDGEGYPIVCRHCGACISFCPHAVLEMETREEPIC